MKTSRPEHATESDLRQALAIATLMGKQAAGDAYRLLAEALRRQDKQEEALQAAEQALQIAQQTGEQQRLGETWRVLGQIAAAGPHAAGADAPPYDAPACFAESLRIFTAMGMASERARTLRAWALQARAAGDATSETRWQEARAIFHDLGLEQEVARMAEIDQAAPVSPRRPL